MCIDGPSCEDLVAAAYLSIGIAAYIFMLGEIRMIPLPGQVEYVPCEKRSPTSTAL
jgi:hypothetical protein